MTSRFSSPLLVSLTDPDEPELDVLVLPGAGTGPSAFSPWCGVVPPTWRITSICLPGRGARIGQPFPTDLHECADLVAEAAANELRAPLALFGHSMGGLLALEVALRIPVHALTMAGTSMAVRTLFAEDLPESTVRGTLQQLLRAAGVEDSPLQQELIDVAAPVLRADMLMLRRYEPTEKQVDCDIVAYYGVDDLVKPMSWQPYTTGRATEVVYEGDHHAIQTDARWFVEDLARRLSTAAR
ncbi:MAG: thioesterase II family protein [Stackebrandtia sp.]